MKVVPLTTLVTRPTKLGSSPSNNATAKYFHENFLFKFSFWNSLNQSLRLTCSFSSLVSVISFLLFSLFAVWKMQVKNHNWKELLTFTTPISINGSWKSWIASSSLILSSHCSYNWILTDKSTSAPVLCWSHCYWSVTNPVQVYTQSPNRSIKLHPFSKISYILIHHFLYLYEFRKIAIHFHSGISLLFDQRRA